jgi:hypothetical protein
MAQTKPAPEAGNEEVWDEAQLEKAMARLKEMHIQVITYVWHWNCRG